MRFLSTNAIVLHSFNQGEADRIVILYTEAKGKLTAVARGARKPKNSLAPLTQLFALSNLLLVKGRNLYIITQGKLKHSFPTFVQDMERFAFASSLLELLDRMTEEEDADKYIFDTLLSHLYVMERAKAPELIAHSWELKLLSHLGYKPELENCLICGAKPKEIKLAFSISGGGIVCPKCFLLAENSLPVSHEAVEFMKKLLSTPAHKLVNEPLPNAQREEIRSILSIYIDTRAGKTGKTSSFLQEIENRSSPLSNGSDI